MPASTHPYAPATVYGHPIPQLVGAAVALFVIAVVVTGLARLIRKARS